MMDLYEIAIVITFSINCCLTMCCQLYDFPFIAFFSEILSISPYMYKRMII